MRSPRARTARSSAESMSDSLGSVDGVGGSEGAGRQEEDAADGGGPRAGGAAAEEACAGAGSGGRSIVIDLRSVWRKKMDGVVDGYRCREPGGTDT